VSYDHSTVDGIDKVKPLERGIYKQDVKTIAFDSAYPVTVCLLLHTHMQNQNTPLHLACQKTATDPTLVNILRNKRIDKYNSVSILCIIQAGTIIILNLLCTYIYINHMTTLVPVLKLH